MLELPWKKKPKTIWGKLKEMKRQADKQAKKYTKKIIFAKANNKKYYYRQLVIGPKLLDLTISVIFIIVVFILFFIKAKNPKFLDGVFPEY